MAVVSTYQSKLSCIISTYIVLIYMDHMHQYKKYLYRKLDTAKDLWKSNTSSEGKALVLLNLV